MKQLLQLSLMSIGIVCLSISSAMAQGVTSSAMNGRVTDSNGESLPGATVVAIHVPTGSKYGNVSDTDGLYRLPNMKVGGPYTITVSFIGFEKYVKEQVYLQLGQRFKLNATMAESATELAEVVITAGGEIFDGNRTGASTNIGVSQINNLPSASRNMTDFLRMTPQATVTGDNVISIVGTPARFNTFFIDGANNTDAFGLESSGTNAGGTGAPPISIDAIEQFTVDIAPFDVTLGGFTGGAISAVTRSGTNEFEGSAYYFWRNQGLAGKTPDEDNETLREKLPDFTAKTYGFRLGGPIIKNKLFFFTNIEIQRNTTPTPSQFDTYNGSVTSTQLDALADRFRTFGYEPGTYNQSVSDELKSDRYLFKLDYNLSDNHKLSARYSFNNVELLGKNASGTSAVNFSNNGEFTVNKTHSASVELKSSIGNNMANKLTLSYTNVLEDRNTINNGRLPAVEIEDGNASIFIGPDPFSTGNLTRQEMFAFTNNFTIFKGKHTITIGTHNEFYKFKNLFLGQNFGDYTYTNIDDFMSGAEPNGFVRSYSLATPDILGDDIESGAAIFNAAQLGVYIQDEIQVTDKFRLTAGLRLDIPMLTTDPVAPFDDFNSVTRPLLEAFHDLKGAEPGKAPSAQLMFSPRIGFNYDLKGDQSTQLRGGIGIFTGRTLFVWAGGAYTNSGGLIGRAEGTVRSNGNPLEYITDLSQLPTSTDLQGGSPATIPQGRLEMFEDGFKWPQVLRISGAIDQKLPWKMVGTFEAIYSYYTNNINLRNVNHDGVPIGLVGDRIGRPIFQAQNELDSRFDEILIAGNASGDYSYNLTWQLTKPFDNGFSGTVAYTFGRSFERNISTSSQLSSMWRRNEVGGYSLDNLPLTRSDFDPGSRIMANVSYRKEYGDNFASAISLFWNSQQGQPFSYVINESNSGFPNRNLRREDVQQRSPHDGNLFYVPISQSDIFLEEYTDSGGNTITAQQQWDQLNQFIENDDYLKYRRGRLAERNVPRAPWSHTLDLKFTQDFYIEMSNGKRNTLQFTLDIFNFTNMLNKDWGKQRFVRFQTVNLVDFRGYLDEEGGDFTPKYRYTLGAIDPEEIYSIDDSGTTSSRWQMQIGARYIFGN